MIELYSITYYILIVFILIFGLIIYLKIAEKCSIIDQPNNRSSHSYNTKRGAGILYLFGLTIYLFYAGFNNYILVISTVLLGTIGFIDDIKNIHFKKKLLFQFIVIFSYLIWRFKQLNNCQIFILLLDKK